MKPHTLLRPLSRTGFTLVEMIVVIVIIAILATLIGPRLFGRIGQSKAAAAASNAKAIASAVKLYAADYGSLPPSIDALAVKSTDAKGFGPYVDNADQLKDPWGQKFILRIPPQKNADFDIVTYGADKTAGGDGDNADIIMP
jgi:general secretion pathway protein G